MGGHVWGCRQLFSLLIWVLVTCVGSVCKNPSSRMCTFLYVYYTSTLKIKNNMKRCLGIALFFKNAFLDSNHSSAPHQGSSLE